MLKTGTTDLMIWASKIYYNFLQVAQNRQKVFMLPTSKRLRGHTGLGPSIVRGPWLRYASHTDKKS